MIFVYDFTCGVISEREGCEWSSGSTLSAAHPSLLSLRAKLPKAGRGPKSDTGRYRMISPFITANCIYILLSLRFAINELA